MILNDEVPPGFEPKPAPAAKVNRVRKPKAVAVLTAPVAAVEPAKLASGAAPWALFGVGLTLVLSAVLNGYANAQHAPNPWAGWLMGVAVPVLVLVLSKVAGEKCQRLAGAE